MDMRHHIDLVNALENKALHGKTNLTESVSMLYSHPTEIVTSIMDARILSGEDLDENDKDVVEQVCNDIANAQLELRNYVTGNFVKIYRSITVKPGWIESMKPGLELGTCWSYDIKGAFAYNGSRSNISIVFEAQISVEDIDWPTTIAVESSGEAEIRTYRGQSIEVNRIFLKMPKNGNEMKPIREDLWDEMFYT